MTKKPIVKYLRALPVGKKTSFPLERFNTVRSLCSNLSISENKAYSTHIDRNKKVIEVKRIKKTKRYES